MHIIKGIRNNLLSKDLCINKNETSEKEKEYASWNDIIVVYEIDKYSTLQKRQMPKITDKHVYPLLILKMRVKHATQVLSGTVANFIELILHLSKGKITFKK